MEVGMPDVILRWLQYMSTFDVEVEYRAGRLHGKADGLSRPPVEGCGERACICSTACHGISKMDPLDGEPDLDSPGHRESNNNINSGINKKRYTNARG